MNVIELQVPDYVEHISDWVDYELPEGQCIVDKDICGCGYTEFCIRPQNRHDTILCSPRIALLENKVEQHLGEPGLLYIENKGLKKNFCDLSNIKETDLKSHNREYMEYLSGLVRGHVLQCRSTGIPVRILCTYDSFHTILDILVDQISQFRVVVDEFQAIFVDSFFKADVENNFFNTLQSVPNVIYLSATPALEKYMMQLDGFKHLPYYKLVWPSDKITMALAREKWVSDVRREILRIIGQYKKCENGMYIHRPWKEIDGKVVYSNEVVFYVNSVSMIGDVITRAKLDPSEVNIICANTTVNQKFLKNLRRIDLPSTNRFQVGKIPGKGEPHKTFTFCTRTVYLGADFYSTSAITVIASDANIDSLVVDIRLDLPQILGRQRLKENPWKNECIIFYSTTNESGGQVTEEQFMKRCKNKHIYTMNYLNVYYDKITNPEEKLLAADSMFPSRNLLGETKKRRRGVDEVLDKGSSNYYLSVFGGQVEFNPFLELSEQRAWELTQKEYINHISVIRSIGDTKYIDTFKYFDREDSIVQSLIDQIKQLPRFDYKFKLYCEFREKFKDDPDITERALAYYRGTDMENLYSHFGIDHCRAVRYQALNLKRDLQDEINSDPLRQEILKNFELGKRYTLKDIKISLKSIYSRVGILNKTAKASDLEDYFNVKACKVYDSSTKKQNKAYLLISIK